VILGEPVDAVIAALLVGLEDEHDVALERHVRAREPHRRRGEDRDAALVVEGTPAIEIAALEHARERIDAPQLGLDAHDVGVRREQDRLAGRVRAAQARDQVRLARRRRRDDVDLEAQRRQPVAHVDGHLRFVAGRIGRVEPDEVAVKRHHLGIRSRHPSAGLASRGAGISRADQSHSDSHQRHGSTAGATHDVPDLPGRCRIRTYPHVSPRTHLPEIHRRAGCITFRARRDDR
jgi:hypothetical protein